LRVVLLGRTGGAGVVLPPFTASYRRIARPDPAVDDQFVALPTTDTAFVTFNTALSIVAADTYVEVETEKVAMAAGDTILVTLSRPSGTGYGAEVGVIRMGAIITSG
jgi:hypothetical protein